MLSIATGYDPRYLTGQVAKGVENYYTKEVRRGEPPGVWQGGGAGMLGLSGQVDDDTMEALYVHFVDPRSPQFRQGRHAWRTAPKLGRPPRKYATADELYAQAGAREPDAEPERLEQLRRQAEQRARKPVSFLDLTFGVPKSFSILHTALRAQEADARAAHDTLRARTWARKAELLERAIWAGNNAALTYLQEHAGFSRAGYHGARVPTGGTAGRWVDAHDWVIASFLQHTNRNEDMHLHIHNAVLNRVLCADGKWRTLDSRAIHRMRAAGGAIAARVMTEQAISLLGVEVAWTDDGNALELLGIAPQARRLFSSRRQEVSTVAAELIAQYEAEHGVAPNALQRTRLALMANKATRQRKRLSKEDWAGRLRRWEQELRTAVDQTLSHIARTVPGRRTHITADGFSRAEIISAALDVVQGKKSSWTRYDLIRALHEQLPACLGGLDAGQVAALLEDLAGEALVAGSAEVVCLAAPDLVPVPAELRLSDGRSVFEAPAETMYATTGQLAAEEALARAVRERAGAALVSHQMVDDAFEVLALQGTEIGADQAAAIRGLVTSRDLISVLIGPAGTGKSFVMGQIADLWTRNTGRQVVGLATAQRAALVLEDEGFPLTDNVDRWLHRQSRLSLGTATGEDQQFRLTPGDLVVVDEAGMSSTAQLAAIQARCAAAGARLILAGDERQLAAIGAGGTFRLMTSATTAHVLDEVRRFASTWERAASLRLRDAEPDVISVYERHGRIVDGGTAEQAAAAAALAWLADTLAGRHSLLVVATAAEAADLSARLRARLADLGRVSADGVPLGHDAAQGTFAGTGDIIQTRRNNWNLRDSNGRAVINRDMWQVTETTTDGGLLARRILGYRDGIRDLGPEVLLPADYVAAHVTLGYAVTIHSAQGSTVDTCYPVLTSRMAADALYVAMTRGRLHNVAYVVTADVADRAPEKPSDTSKKKTRRPGETKVTPGQVFSSILQRAYPDLSATELQRELLHASGSLPVLGTRWAEAISLSGQQRISSILDQLAAENVLPAAHYERLTADEACGTLWRLIRHTELSGHDPYTVLRHAISEWQLDTAASVAEVLHYRITRRYGDGLLPHADTFAARTPAGTDPVSRYAAAVAQAMDHRCAELGEQTAADPAGWPAAWLGTPPAEPAGRAEWVRRAGVIAGYRELYWPTGDTNDHNPVGPVPPPGRPEARAAWFAAWRALGKPQDLAAETTMSVPALAGAVAAYARARQWAPDWVGGYLRHDIEAGRHHEQQGHLLHAQSATQTDPATSEKLRAAAQQHHQIAAQHHANAGQLSKIDEARAQWYTHTDPLRQAASRAVAELRRRELDPSGHPLQETGPPGKPSSKAGRKPKKRNDSREAAAFPGDISEALEKAHAAQQRITAERAAADHAPQTAPLQRAPSRSDDAAVR